jgi:type I restriction enzyme M protein
VLRIRPVATGLTLTCPIRGPLKAPAKSADGLTPSEEARRIEAINFLLKKGYPKQNFKVEATIKRFGHGGKNSFRSDLAVLDVPVASIDASKVDELLAHAVLLGEIKRDSAKSAYVKETQVEPMLDFAHTDECIALYWDDVGGRIFWREKKGGKRVSHEAPAPSMPAFGAKPSVKPLSLDDTQPSDSLLDAFTRIEDTLHAASIDPEARYGIMLQLLLAKLYDEHGHAAAPTKPLDLQDFKALGTKPTAALAAANKVLGKAVSYYGKFLPRAVASKFPFTASTLLEVMEVLAPIRIVASSHEVIQTFYMHFAKHLYKWDLAQFFTPITVCDFMAQVLAPRFGEHIKDPACGSADFLVSAFRIGSQHDPNFAQAVWGADNSENAVQVAVLNMLLNGDGKTNLVREDSLEQVAKDEEKFEMLICNPPFGTQIVEKRRTVLADFELGYEWLPDKSNVMQKTDTVRDKQQVGLLFLELCVRQAKAGGRVAIILPNGYLGNRSNSYRALREWLLRHCRVASICSFPRFTFKTSGADVSASVLFLEKRAKPLKKAAADSKYDFHVGLIESVGWELGDKGAKALYQRDPTDGTLITDTHGNPLLLQDFDRMVADMRRSKAATRFKWLAGGATSGKKDGWSISAAKVTDDPLLTLDPKRLSRKAVELRDELASKPHFRLGDLVEFVTESGAAWPVSNTYRYVELQDITAGSYRWTTLRGWELPSRARHAAESGDVFVGSVWGSVQKWMVTGGDTDGLLVTNGCRRLRMKKGKEKYLLDLVVALSTESYATQMRALARGSDGLAEVHEDDAAEVFIPKITSSKQRKELEPFVKQLLAGYTSVRAKVDDMIESGDLPIPVPDKRPSHSVLV